MRLYCYLFLFLGSLCCTSCLRITPLAAVEYKEQPFVRLKASRGMDTLKANADIVSSSGIDKRAASSYGGIKNVAMYGDGTNRWGNYKNRFYPLVSTGKLDVYQGITIIQTGGSPTSAPVSETKIFYLFNKSGSTTVNKANYANLKPIVQGNAELRSQLSGFNIVNKISTVTYYGGFAATVAGFYLFYKAFTEVEGTDKSPSLGTATFVTLGGFTTYLASSIINRANRRKIPKILLKYNRDQSAYRRK